MDAFQVFASLLHDLRTIVLMAFYDRLDEGLSRVYGFPMIAGDGTWYGQRLYSSVKKIRKDNDWTPTLDEKEDILQEVHLVWAKCQKMYKDPVLLRRRLIDRTVEEMIAWANRQAKQVTVYPYYYFVDEKPEIVLDLEFLICGTHVYPFSQLTPYERYLIFLKYREEKEPGEIAKVVYKHHNTVRKELRDILDKLRRLSDEEEDSIRSCGRGNGCPSTSGSYTEGCCAWDRDTTPEADQRDCGSAGECAKSSP